MIHNKQTQGMLDWKEPSNIAWIKGIETLSHTKFCEVCGIQNKQFSSLQGAL
jgi:hypothetical protein